MFVKFVILTCCFLVGSWAIVYAAETGFLKGHLKIISPQEVQLADQTQSQETSIYAEFPLVILSKDGKTEIARVVADSKGNYQIALSPGEYILDAPGRLRGHLRVKPEHFTVVMNQTVQVDMTIDTGVR